MKIFTASSDEYRPLADITEKTKSDYATRYGHDFVAGWHSGQRVAWERVEHWIAQRPGSEWMWASGTDVGVTHQDFDMFSYLVETYGTDYDLLICCDGNGLQADSFIIRDCEKCREFLDRVMDCENRIMHEQDSMHVVLARFDSVTESRAKPLGSGWYLTIPQHDILQTELNASPVKVKIISQRQLNAYPVEFYGGQPASHPLAWHKGDFAAHMVANTIPNRVAAFRSMLGL